MAYDTGLDELLGGIVTPWGAERKAMFGGTGYLINGNMVAGVHKDWLVLRLSAEDGDAALGEPGVRVFDITGRPMKGWVMVDAEHARGDWLERWLERARVHAESLPPK